MGFPFGSVVKNPPAMQETWVPSLGGEDSPGEGNGKPTPGFLPGKSHGQRSLVGYSAWGCKESYTTEYIRTAHIPIFFRGLFTSYKPTPC